MIKKLWRKFLCKIGDHDWTSKAMEGIKPDVAKIFADPTGHFKEYAKMYCKHCGHVSTLN